MLRACLLMVLVVASTLQFVAPAQAAVGSAAKVVAVEELQLTESTPIAGETVKATGTLSGVISRPIVLQRKSGGGWITLAEATTSSTGAYATSFSAPAVGSYQVRVLAPKFKVAQKTQAEYVSASVTLTVVAQTVPSITGKVTDSGPVPQGLANVRVSVFSPATQLASAVYTASDGTYAVSGLAAGTDLQVAFYGAGATGGFSDALGYLDEAYDDQSLLGGTPTSVTVTEGVTTTGIDAALATGGALTGTVTDAGTGHGLSDVQVYVSSPTNGNYYGFATTAADGTYTVQGMPANAEYQVCFDANAALGGSTGAFGYLNECYDNQPTASSATPVAVAAGELRQGVNAALAEGGAISGTVTEASGTNHGLADVWVDVVSMSSDNNGGRAVTAADGSYTVMGLTAGIEYQVCFSSAGATGGSSDAIGYVDQCYDIQSSGSVTPVTVSAGAITTGVDVALAAGAGAGAISGTVTEDGGTGQGLANVWVNVSSSTDGNLGGYAMTAADGSYNVPNLADGADYTVCFSGGGAVGGSSDPLGYVDQCYDNQPVSGTPTPVTVSGGIATTGIDVALVGAP